MSQKGWIKLQRKITDCWIWDDGSPFDRRSAWIDLLLTANHADKKVVLDGQITTVKRGQILTSVRKLSERWKWSRTKVTAFLGILEKDGMVLKESDTKKTLITVENYGFYQDSDSEEKPPKSHRSATEVPPKDTNNNDKNDKNDKKRERVRTHFTPPTLEDVTAYCQERHNNIDPQHFLDYYQRQNWRLANGVHMADWKAAVRTWERRDKEQQQKQAERWGNDPDQRKEYGGEIDWGC